MRTIILHNHIFKNAGTTVDWALQRSFGGRFVDHRDDAAMMSGGMPYVEEFIKANESTVAVSSHHMPFSLSYTATALRFWHLFMLRDPLARALSVYDYESRQPAAESEGAKMGKSLSLKEYFRWYLEDYGSAPVLRSHYVRQLTDDWDSNKVLGVDDLRLAGRNLESQWVLIGLVERFDESMALFELTLRPDFPEIDFCYVTQNQRRSKGIDARGQLVEKLGPDLFNVLLSNTALDVDLYKMVSERMDAQIAAIPDFDRHLKVFKERRTRLQLAVNNDVFLLDTIMNKL